MDKTIRRLEQMFWIKFLDKAKTLHAPRKRDFQTFKSLLKVKKL